MSSLERATRCAGFVMAHAAWIASDMQPGELICPFTVITRESERNVVAFESESQAEAVEKGKASFEQMREKVDQWSFAREGLHSVGGQNAPKRDVLAVSSWVQGLDEPIVLQQLFTPSSKGQFHLLGEMMISIHGVLVPDQVQRRLAGIALVGVAEHPHGAKWKHWLKPQG